MHRLMFGLDERREKAGGGGGEVLTILTHTSPQIGPPSGGWEDKGRNEKLLVIHTAIQICMREYFSVWLWNNTSPQISAATSGG